MQGYDHQSEFEQGREDALNGFPRRLSQTAYYRQGYDRGLTEWADANCKGSLSTSSPETWNY